MISSLILASGSPRRRELLQEANLSFSVEISDVDEIDSQSHPALSAEELAQENALKKAVFAAKKHPEKYILAADTIVVCDGHVLGKPLDEKDARRMLMHMSGKTHEVLTAVVLLCADKKIQKEHLERSRVKFKPMDEKKISEYMSVVNVMDKAGAYALQEHGEMIIEKVEGSRTNVIGLPMEIVRTWLNENF